MPHPLVAVSDPARIIRVSARKSWVEFRKKSVLYASWLAHFLRAGYIGGVK